jgi:transposase
MSRPYSLDLRKRVVAAVAGGLSRRQAAVRFDVGISTVIRWTRRARETGSAAARPRGGDRRSLWVGAPRVWLLERVAAEPDLTLEELRDELAAQGIAVGYGTVWRFFEREAITFKKKRARGRARAA